MCYDLGVVQSSYVDIGKYSPTVTDCSFSGAGAMSRGLGRPEAGGDVLGEGAASHPPHEL